MTEGQTGWQRAEEGSLAAAAAAAALSKHQNGAESCFSRRASGGPGSQLAGLSPDSSLLRDLQSQSAHTGKRRAAGKHATLNETRMFTLAQSPRSCSYPARPMAAAHLLRGSQWKRRVSPRSANARLHLQTRSQWQPGTACNHATARSVALCCHAAATQLPGRRTKQSTGSTWGESGGCSSERTAPCTASGVGGWGGVRCIPADCNTDRRGGDGGNI